MLFASDSRGFIYQLNLDNNISTTLIDGSLSNQFYTGLAVDPNSDFGYIVNWEGATPIVEQFELVTNSYTGTFIDTPQIFPITIPPSPRYSLNSLEFINGTLYGIGQDFSFSPPYPSLLLEFNFDTITLTTLSLIDVIDSSSTLTTIPPPFNGIAHNYDTGKTFLSSGGVAQTGVLPGIYRLDGPLNGTLTAVWIVDVVFPTTITNQSLSSFTYARGEYYGGSNLPDEGYLYKMGSVGGVPNGVLTLYNVLPRPTPGSTALSGLSYKP